MTIMLLWSLTVLYPTCLIAAKPVWVDSLELSAGALMTNDRQVPFWIWANRDGRVPQTGNRVFTRFRASRHGDADREIDWQYGLDLTARSGADPELRWTDAWAGLRYRNIRLVAGRRSEHFGLADSLLTAGPEVYSRNAPTIPKIAITTNGYVDITDWVAVNAYFAHGWLGDDPYRTKPFLHEKYLYLRFGEAIPDDGVNVHIGIHDTAIWGGSGQPSAISDYWKVISGSSGDNDASISDQINALGDHRGTLETAVKFKGPSLDWYLYAMSMYEDRSGLKLFDPADWLTGVSLIIKDPYSRLARINIEYLDTRQSSGHEWEPDNYFCGQYGGWVHESYAIGTPFIPFIRGTNGTWSPLNRIQAVNGSLLARYSPLLNPLFRAAWIRVSGSFNGGLLPEDQRRTTVALDLSNTMHIAQEWTLSQEFSLDLIDKASPKMGAMFSVSRLWF